MQTTTANAPIPVPHVFVGAMDKRHCMPNHQVCEISPKLIINFYLRGGQRFLIDGVEFVGAAKEERSTRPRVHMINVKQCARLQFANDTVGSNLRKVFTSASLSWLEQELGGGTGRPPALERFLATHLSHFVFEPSAALIELAEQISRPPADLGGEQLTLYRKARGLEIVRLCYAALVADAERISRRRSLSTVRQSERVRSYILANLTRDLRIDEIARECGASVSSVQRHFKQEFDTTVFEFIRRKRLEAARDALACRGVSVAESAWIAGYDSRTAFIAAFKKAFGASPGELRSCSGHAQGLTHSR